MMIRWDFHEILTNDLGGVQNSFQTFQNGAQQSPQWRTACLNDKLTLHVMTTGWFQADLEAELMVPT